MSELEDHDLLAQYARENSQSAFSALVSRHLNLVYSVAARNTNNAHAAEEIAQTVFIILAKKASKLPRRVVLSGWLYHTTRLTAANYLRAEIRRQKREQEAFMQSLSNETETWRRIAPVLEEAMSRLGEKERDAVVLRYFENKSLREVGLALGASEDAAKMRVNRALEKLRKLFGKRGMALSGAAIAAAVSANSVQAAPMALAKTISTVAVAQGATASGSTLTLVKGALKFMAWTKTQTAIVTGAIVLLTTGTTTVVVKEIQGLQPYPWQVESADSDVLWKVPPQVAIARSRHPGAIGRGNVSLWSPAGGQKTLGISQSIEDIVSTAYSQGLTRTVFQTPVAAGKFDFIANLASGNNQALQREVQRKFGLVGHTELRPTDVLALRINYPHAAGLKPFDPSRLDPNSGGYNRLTAGQYTCRDCRLSILAGSLEGRFKIPVIDQTGLTNAFDIDLNWAEPDFNQPNLTGLKAALLDELGLELVPTNMPIEMLVIDKAKW